MAGTITGKHVLYDASITVNSVDLSIRVETVTIIVGINKQNGAAMGDLQDYSIPGTLTVTDPSITFYQDYNTSQVYATLSALQQARTIFNVVGKASSGANAPTNPQFTIPCFVQEMPFISGTRGDRHMAPVKFAVAGLLAIAIA
jgi:hypothetical protein